MKLCKDCIWARENNSDCFHDKNIVDDLVRGGTKCKYFISFCREEICKGEFWAAKDE